MSNIDIRPGDCLDVMRGMVKRGEKVSAVVTDGPYELTSVVKRFGKAGSAPAQVGATGVYARASTGFMGQRWDGTGIAFNPEVWSLCYALLPPGGYLLAFGGTRTQHRMVCAIEDAGFEVRDCIMWVYGTGFPKSHDVSKGIDRTIGKKGAFGAPKSEAHAGWISRARMRGDNNEEGWQRPWMDDPVQVENAARRYLPATDAAKQWQGWGSALKPAVELICVARKPLIGTLAQNVMAHGTGALNIDGCRVGEGADKSLGGNSGQSKVAGGLHGGGVRSSVPTDYSVGRWPANLVHDSSEEVEDAFAAFGERPGQQGRARIDGVAQDNNIYGALRHVTNQPEPRGDGGTASRFFYSAKAGKEDRAGSRHPTVKPVSLIRWLTRLVTPPGGTVLDPFAGSGTTGAAALAEGFNAILIEKEQQYLADIYRRFGREPTIATAWRQWGEALANRDKAMRDG